MKERFFRRWSNRKVKKKKQQKTKEFSIILDKGNASTHELMLTTISDVVKQLIDAYEQGKEIDLNK